MKMNIVRAEKMENETLDLSSFKKAIASLKEVIAVSQNLIKNAIDTPEEKAVRAGVIQNFEFTYELSWKMMQRALTMYFSINESLNKRDLFRKAFENKLIQDSQPWFDYYKARNRTSHTYNEDIADEVFNAAKKFLQDVEILLKNLEEIIKQ